MEILIVGGTRNLGPGLVAALLARGHRVAVCTRGVTPDDLPAEVERLRADRRERAELERALAGRSFDGVVDTALYAGAEAADAVELLDGRVGRFVALSSGQVYLLREGLARPFVEEDYDGPVMPPPPAGTPDRAEWGYGAGKREVEDRLAEAAARRGFPAVVLRLPMIHGERDHYHRLHNYVARLADGGPILLPAGPHLPVRHVDAVDVVRAIVELLETGRGVGRAYNLSQAETLPIEECLERLARSLGRPLELVRLPRARLLAEGLLPAASPFSNPWMSELDPARARAELNFAATPFDTTMARLARHYATLPPPAGYAQRPRELVLASRAGERP